MDKLWGVGVEKLWGGVMGMTKVWGRAKEKVWHGGMGRVRGGGVEKVKGRVVEVGEWKKCGVGVAVFEYFRETLHGHRSVSFEVMRTM